MKNIWINQLFCCTFWPSLRTTMKSYNQAYINAVFYNHNNRRRKKTNGVKTYGVYIHSASKREKGILVFLVSIQTDAAIFFPPTLILFSSVYFTEMH